jgi:hypothetical protein
MFDLIAQFRPAEGKIDIEMLQLLKHGIVSAMELVLHAKYSRLNSINHLAKQAVYSDPNYPTC